MSGSAIDQAITKERKRVDKKLFELNVKIFETIKMIEMLHKDLKQLEIKISVLGVINKVEI